MSDVVDARGQRRGRPRGGRKLGVQTAGIRLEPWMREAVWFAARQAGRNFTQQIEHYISIGLTYDRKVTKLEADSKRMRYRWKTPTAKGEWCETLHDAWQSAARAGVAHKDEHGRIFLDVFTKIENKKFS